MQMAGSCFCSPATLSDGQLGPADVCVCVPEDCGGGVPVPPKVLVLVPQGHLIPVYHLLLRLKPGPHRAPALPAPQWEDTCWNTQGLPMLDLTASPFRTLRPHPPGHCTLTLPSAGLGPGLTPRGLCQFPPDNPRCPPPKGAALVMSLLGDTDLQFGCLSASVSSGQAPQH